MSPTTPRLSSVLPPLIFGTATFNYQYNTDPYQLATTDLVHKAFSLGIRAFDTSPYYGPSEEILGKALIHPYENTLVPFPRKEYFLVTKVGRIASSKFDYSAPWVYQSIQRSLARLKTSYLDVVYCHDVEFVTVAEVLTAVKELRRIRDIEGTLKYIGISGYPISVLCNLAELILKETGEPLDCVMSYANFTLQNRRLKSEGLSHFKAAGVDIVLNASMLGMGLLRSEGVPEGSMGDWHPAPVGLRAACRAASEYSDSIGEKLEVVALRWALESWLIEGESVGSLGDPASGLKWRPETIDEVGNRRLGVNIMGVSNMQELEETMRVWRSILDGLEGGRETAVQAGRWEGDHEWSLKRRDEVRVIVDHLRKNQLVKWQEFAWESPGEGFVRVPSATENDRVLLGIED